jgi:ABC-2 type transport system ATP-binding protein
MSKQTAPEPIIRVENLVKRYKKATSNAVNGISLEVFPGEFFAFLGPNGAGKTTTISILTTTLSKTSGTITIAGHDLARQSKQVRQNIGIIFQNPSLDLELTAEENIRLHAGLYGTFRFMPSYRLMPQAYKDKVEQLAALIGLEADLFKPVKTFSGGMKRKLEIVRSLLHDPRVLFLDEPTSGLDPVSRHDLWQYLQKVRREHGTTIFLTTHYLDEAEGADRVCIISKGSILSLSALLGYAPFASDSTSLWQSHDGGATWTPLGGSLPKEVDGQANGVRISNIVWDPNNANMVYASGNKGLVWKSTDGGKTWTTLATLKSFK